MLEILRAIAAGPATSVARQAAAFGAAFVVANLAYRFGSFGLELIAFLVTWLALDALFGWAHDHVS